MADVGGMENVKRRLEVSFLGPMRNPDLRAAYGKSLRGGLMLFGPPGCGKTYIARALAGELVAKFISVGLADILDMWLGNEASRSFPRGHEARAVRGVPDRTPRPEAHASTQITPRSGRWWNQRLSLTARPWGEGVCAGRDQPSVDVDSAPWAWRLTAWLVLRRDREARVAISTGNRWPSDRVGRVGAIADKTEGFSGADLTYLCDSATELAMEEAIQSGAMKLIGQQHFQKALKELRPSTREWFETARNFALFSNQSGVYDELIRYMKGAKLLCAETRSRRRMPCWLSTGPATRSTSFCTQSRPIQATSKPGSCLDSR